MGSCQVKKKEIKPLPRMEVQRDLNTIQSLESIEELSPEFLSIGSSSQVIVLKQKVLEKYLLLGVFQPVAALSDPEEQHRFRYDLENKNGVFFGELTAAGVRHGIGKCVWPRGFFLEGTWQEGRVHGYSRLIYPNGDVFIGFMRNNQATGKGSLYTDTHDLHGDWYRNVLGGQGCQIFRDKSRYEGCFMTGKYHGKGRLIYPGGLRFEGTFNYGLKIDLGKYTFPDGQVLETVFVNDMINGPGKLGDLEGRFTQLDQTYETMTVRCQKQDGSIHDIIIRIR